MPKQTFLNLPAEKQKNILEAAVNEFADYGYEAASINRIVASSGISKGSFYQYFEDKMDIFRHLMDVVGAEKTQYFSGKSPPTPGQSVFEYFRWMMKIGMEFNSAYPRMAQAATRVLFAEGHYYGKLFEDYQKQSRDALAMLIRQAIKNGEVDSSIDMELAVTVLEIWMNAITTYIMNEGMKQKDILKWMRSTKTQEKLDKLLYVMEFGLRKTESEFETHF